MGDWTGQRDMPHPLPTDLGLNDLNAALLTHDPTVAHAFVFAAVTLIVLGRTEYLGAEQAVTLRLERAIIDGLGLLHLPMRPGTDHIRRGQRDPDGIKTNRILGLLKKTKKIFHLSPQRALFFFEQFDVERQALQFSDHDIKRFGQARFQYVFSFHNRLIDTRPTGHIIRLDRQHFL